jgi:hypothetical protein
MNFNHELYEPETAYEMATEAAYEDGYSDALNAATRDDGRYPLSVGLGLYLFGMALGFGIGLLF